MNFVAGFLLITSGCREVESFWVFVSLLSNSGRPVSQDETPTDEVPVMAGLHGFYSEGFPNMLKIQNVFNVLFKEILPNLFYHFEDEGVTDLLWISKWFQSCFLYSFPLGLCLRIWDNVLAYGTRFLLSAALAILKLIEPSLIQLNFGDINDFFK